MKHNRLQSILFAAALVLATGCQTVSDTTLLRLETVTTRVVQAGAVAALTAKPVEARAYLKEISKSLEVSIAAGTVTATQLGSIVNALDLDPNVIRWSTAGFMVYDTLSLFWMTAATDQVLLSLARGMDAGIVNAMLTLSAPAEATAGLRAAAAPNGPAKPLELVRKDWALTTPLPTPTNTKKI